MQKHSLIRVAQAQKVTNFLPREPLDISQNDDVPLRVREGVNGGDEAELELGGPRRVFRAVRPSVRKSEPMPGPVRVVPVKPRRIDRWLGASFTQLVQ